MAACKGQKLLHIAMLSVVTCLGLRRCIAPGMPASGHTSLQLRISCAADCHGRTATGGQHPYGAVYATLLACMPLQLKQKQLQEHTTDCQQAVSPKQSLVSYQQVPNSQQYPVSLCLLKTSYMFCAITSDCFRAWLLSPSYTRWS